MTSLAKSPINHGQVSCATAADSRPHSALRSRVPAPAAPQRPRRAHDGPVERRTGGPRIGRHAGTAEEGSPLTVAVGSTSARPGAPPLTTPLTSGNVSERLHPTRMRRWLSLIGGLELVAGGALRTRTRGSMAVGWPPFGQVVVCVRLCAAGAGHRPPPAAGLVVRAAVVADMATYAAWSARPAGGRSADSRAAGGERGHDL